MPEYPGSLSRTTSRANGTRISRHDWQVTPLFLPSNCPASTTGRSPFLSSTSLDTETNVKYRSTSRIQSGLVGWMANESRAGGRKLRPWQLGHGRVARMLAVGSLMTTGTLAIGKSCWDFVSARPNHSQHNLIPQAGTFLDRNLRRSLAWKTSQREVADLMSGSYPADVVSKWRGMRDDFDRDPSKPNPYEDVDDRMVFLVLKLHRI